MEEIINAPVPELVEVVDIQFRPGQKVYYFAPGGITCQTGDHVIMDTARGPEYGICTGGNHMISARDVVAPLRSILRIATEKDERIVAENRAKERRAHEICLQKIQEHSLDMQLVSAEYAFDGSKILFFFTADERVDFRELVKNLAGIFHTRIELRQIGVRDKAKMVGGLGICGRPFCCAEFLDDFQPVSIKMAKTQNLSLNPTKISGTCGRLMCCLKYEQEAYEDLIRNAPKAESFVDTPEGRGTVVEVELLRQRVKVRLEDSPETVSVFHNEEIAIFRNGKAKKNDQPIPADWAPISGNGKRARKTERDEPVFLDPIKFRYSTETIADEAAPVQEPPTEEAEQSRSRRSRRNRRNRSEDTPKQPQEQPKEETKKEKPAKSHRKEQRPAAPKKEQPPKEAPQEPAQAEGEGAKKSGHRRPYHHRRRRPGANKGGEQK